MQGDHALHYRVGFAVKHAMRQERRFLKQLVGRNPQALGESVQCPRLRPIGAAKHPFNRTRIQPSHFSDLAYREAKASHQPTQVVSDVWHERKEQMV